MILTKDLLSCQENYFGSFTSCTGNEEIRYHLLPARIWRYTEILVFVTMNKHHTIIFDRTKKHKHRAQHGATIIIIIVVIITISVALLRQLLLTKWDRLFYYKVRWSVITKCDNFVTMCYRYYKVWQNKQWLRPTAFQILAFKLISSTEKTSLQDISLVP